MVNQRGLATLAEPLRLKALDAKHRDTRPYPFICVEGVDGVGKTTVAKELASALGGVYYKTPPEPFSSIRTLVDHGAPSEARFHFYVSSVIWASREISRILFERPVVSDRYIYSTLAYHRVLSPDLPPLILRPQSIRRPDYAVLLIASEAARSSRLQHRTKVDSTHDARIEADTGLLSAVELEFKAMRLDVVDTTALTSREVTTAILGRLHSVLSEGRRCCCG